MVFDFIIFALANYLLALQMLAREGMVMAAVASSFKECRQFMFMRTAPTGVHGNGLRCICQQLQDKPRYATLYDSNARSPVYSAYTFKKSNGQERMDTPWMYEPQLVSQEESSNMKILPPLTELDPLIEDSQATLQDFTDAVQYERGPLNPDQHQFDKNDKSATYTLTNHVPMVSAFLDDYWIPYIDIVRRRLNNFCRGISYVITGVTISGKMIRRGNIPRLAVPKYVWLAYCCPRFDRNSPYEVRFMFPTYAAYGMNDLVDHSVTEVPLKTLEKLLVNQTDMFQNLQLFHKDCIMENTAKRK